MNQQNPKNDSTNVAAGAPRLVSFDHERLDVYRLELEFIGWVARLIEEISHRHSTHKGEIVDQLDRASLSALLNTAEGNGKRQRQVRAKFFDDARGSATECGACLDAIVAKRLADGARIAEGKQLLVRIVSMLCKLVDRFEDTACLREDEGEYFTRGELKNAGDSRTRTRTTTRTKRI